MKKIISTTIILSLLLSLFTISVSANETVNVLINKSINFEVMDEEFIPYDFSINSIVYPITYNDRTYIPARFLAEAIGLTVTWDDTTNTVGFVDKGANAIVYDAQHGDRTPFNDTALLNKNIKFTMNGEPFVPTETDGSICYPLTYKDRTYIPARFIAEKAGLAVDWDSATKTVIIDYKNDVVEFTPTDTPEPIEPSTPVMPDTPEPVIPNVGNEELFKDASEITIAVLNSPNLSLNGDTSYTEIATGAISKLPELMSFVNTNVPVLTIKEENVSLNGNTIDFKDNAEIVFVFEPTDIDTLKDYLEKNITTYTYKSKVTNSYAIALAGRLTLIVDFSSGRVTIGNKVTPQEYMENEARKIR